MVVGIQESSQDIAEWFESTIGIESRVSILGHIQRGGNPTVKDRLMAYKFIVNAVDALLSGKDESVICYDRFGFNFKSIKEVVSKTKELDEELLSYLK